jgi:hypothetical protein
VSSASINLSVASQRVFIVDFVIYSVRKLLDTPWYVIEFTAVKIKSNFLNI